jgi:hypothetical protein
MSEQQSSVHNPFMLMLNPEIVLAAMEKSERLAQLNRHLCRPLDRVAPGSSKEGGPNGDGALEVDGADEVDEAESGTTP